MEKSLKIFEIFGIKVRVHFTFLLLPAFIGFGVFFTEGAMNAVRSIVFVMFLFTCVIFHEISHSLVAQKFKIKVKHITLFPIGGIAFMERMPDKPKQEFLMSLAGPLFNIVLAVLLFYPLYL
ncbi:MAG: site-2 protease family protein, partial [Candidatus Omnitrophica bacterium]|nr:site-2 protease family protein [Candidatus Omnitrophota bacterium]